MSQLKTRKELANELGIHPKTLTRWLEKYNISISSGLLSPVEQDIIYKGLGFKRASE